MVWSTWKYEVEPALHSVSLQSKYYYRTGSTLQELKGDKLTRFIMKKQGEHWDAIAVNEVKPTDLSSKAFTLFKTKAHHSKRLSGGDINQTDIDLLEKLHLLRAALEIN
jgi:ATP-dependent DNA helicase RecG